MLLMLRESTTVKDDFKFSTICLVIALISLSTQFLRRSRLQAEQNIVARSDTSRNARSRYGVSCTRSYADVLLTVDGEAGRRCIYATACLEFPEYFACFIVHGVDMAVWRTRKYQSAAR